MGLRDPSTLSAIIDQGYLLAVLVLGRAPSDPARLRRLVAEEIMGALRELSVPPRWQLGDPPVPEEES